MWKQNPIGKIYRLVPRYPRTPSTITPLHMTYEKQTNHRRVLSPGLTFSARIQLNMNLSLICSRSIFSGNNHRLHTCFKKAFAIKSPQLPLKEKKIKNKKCEPNLLICNPKTGKPAWETLCYLLNVLLKRPLKIIGTRGRTKSYKIYLYVWHC